MLGTLPFYPITPLIGVVAGITALVRGRSGQLPTGSSLRLILIGMVGGLAWLVIGTMLIVNFTDAARDFFLFSPLKWLIEGRPHGSLI